MRQAWLSSFTLSSGAMPRPVAVICGAVLINNVGGALGAASLVLFLVQVRGFSPGIIATLILASSVVAFCVAGPLGWIADRLGTRPTLQLYLLGMAVCNAGLAFATAAWELAALLAVFYALDRGVSGVAGAVVVDIVDKPLRAEVRGLVRTYALVGSTSGFIISLPLIATGDRSWLMIAILLDALTYVFAAAIYTLLPRTPRDIAATVGHPWQANLNVSFLWRAVLVCLPAALFPLLSFAVPILLAEQVVIPVAVLPVLFIASGTLVAIVQVHVSRRIATLRQARRALLVAPAFACGAYGMVFVSFTVTGSTVATVALILAVVFFAMYRAVVTAVQFTAAYDLSPSASQAQYQAVFGTVLAVAIAGGPTLYTVAISAPVTWAIMGALSVAFCLFAAAGARPMPTTSTDDRPDHVADRPPEPLPTERKVGRGRLF